MPDYTLCELRSWLSAQCSTRFNVSGTAGNHLYTECEGHSDPDAYLHSFAPGTSWPPPDPNWNSLIVQWAMSMDFNGGTYNNDASNARILSQLVLGYPRLPTIMPSLAEAFAALLASTLIQASQSAPFHHLVAARSHLAIIRACFRNLQRIRPLNRVHVLAYLRLAESFLRRSGARLCNQRLLPRISGHLLRPGHRLHRAPESLRAGNQLAVEQSALWILRRGPPEAGAGDAMARRIRAAREPLFFRRR